MKNVSLQQSHFDFLKQLKKNNNRDWFQKHKERYQAELENITAFADALLAEMNKHDVIENPTGKSSLFRIYRDVRFSKDKKPYKNHFSLSLKRQGKNRRGSYYFHLEPGNSFAAGGFWEPNPEDLKRIRDEFSFDPAPFRKIINSKNFKKYFGELEGEQIKTTPKGFSPDDPAIDLLRFKQYELIRPFKDSEILKPGFVKELNNTFKQMRPFLDFMTEVLTTDINGEAR